MKHLRKYWYWWEKPFIALFSLIFTVVCIVIDDLFTNDFLKLWCSHQRPLIGFGRKRGFTISLVEYTNEAHPILVISDSDDFALASDGRHLWVLDHDDNCDDINIYLILFVSFKIPRAYKIAFRNALIGATHTG